MILVSIADFEGHCRDHDGVCKACGEWTFGGVEPDAENYTCESCEKDQVFGAEIALVAGILAIDDRGL